VSLRHRDLMVFATIKQTDLLSGHGDHDDLLNTVKQQNPESLKRVFLVHGEDNSLQALSAAINEAGYKATIPEKGEVYEL